MINSQKISAIFEYKGRKYEQRLGLIRQYFVKHPKGWRVLSQPDNNIPSGQQRFIPHFGLNNNNLEIIDFQYFNGQMNEYQSRLNEIFPKQNDKIIDWFSGVVIISPEELKSFWLFSILKEDKPYYILDFENGILKNEIFINRGELKSFREEQFLIYQQTPEYIEFSKKHFPTIKKIRKLSDDEFKEDLKLKIPFCTKKILK